MAGMRRTRVIVSGRVQGVFFRASTERMARELGLHGSVRNLEDGRVEAIFEGPAEQVAQALEWCRSGPPAARVSALEHVEEPPLGGEHGFQILR